jgi:hypothetical protein
MIVISEPLVSGKAEGRTTKKRRLARVWAINGGGVDLNEMGCAALLFRGFVPGEANVYGQDPIRPADGFLPWTTFARTVERYGSE